MYSAYVQPHDEELQEHDERAEKVHVQIDEEIQCRHRHGHHWKDKRPKRSHIQHRQCRSDIEEEPLKLMQQTDARERALFQYYLKIGNSIHKGRLINLIYRYIYIPVHLHWLKQ